MTPDAFIAKWSRAELTERASYQQHFLDLCELVDHQKPAAVDPTGESFCFEKGASKSAGGDGFADVWKRGVFAFEYKGKHKNLDAAYQQLLQYRESLENPPLLVVCDTDRLLIHTNFTGTVKKVYTLALADVSTPAGLDVLRKLFHQPDGLRPGRTSQAVTEDAATRFGDLAQRMRDRGLAPDAVARFLDRVIFCLFAEDVSLLPTGIFQRVMERVGDDAGMLARYMGDLFGAMATGGDFLLEPIPHFNGNLFDNTAALELQRDEIAVIRKAASLDWGSIDASIFGTLFERGLDPGKRAQIGAHYTSREDVELLVDPVVMLPLRQEWDEARTVIDRLLDTGRKTPVPSGQVAQRPTGAALTKALKEAYQLKSRFLQRLAQVTVLDPACGSGNFLNVALQKLKDLEKEALVYRGADGLATDFFPQVSPRQFHGIEVNRYAYELAQMSLWIGYLQWCRHNGFGLTDRPLLKEMSTFENRDAILDLTDPEHPKEPEWPKVEFIVGNPPFLGNKRIKSELGQDYFGKLHAVYGERLPAMSDLCVYWLEKARAAVQTGRAVRAGMLATAAVKQVGSRQVLERIGGGDTQIIFAISDRDWSLDGASVRICMIGIASRSTADVPTLDGVEVSAINADLTSGTDVTRKRPLHSNAGVCFMGTTKVGAFDCTDSVALALLERPNPHGRPNSDVLRPFVNGSDLVRGNSRRWIIDFGIGTLLSDAALYEAPFEYLVRYVRPLREVNADAWRRTHWWLLGRTLPEFRKAVSGLARYSATPRVAKHRIFVWLDTVVLPDSKVIAIAIPEDWRWGILHSRIHEAWTLATCGWHGIGNDPTYNSTECFETFPFPTANECQQRSIARAATELYALRERWLNPPEWTRDDVLTFPGSVDGPWARFLKDPNTEGVGTVHYTRRVPVDEKARSELTRRTLTNLYNARPAWLDNAHRALDEAVAAAYGFPVDLSDDEILARLLALNLERVHAGPNVAAT